MKHAYVWWFTNRIVVMHFGSWSMVEQARIIASGFVFFYVFHYDFWVFTDVHCASRAFCPLVPLGVSQHLHSGQFQLRSPPQRPQNKHGGTWGRETTVFNMFNDYNDCLTTES